MFMKKSQFESMVPNKGECFEDQIFPDWQVNGKESIRKKTKNICYCTSYSCNGPKSPLRGTAAANGTGVLSKHRIIENSLHGWCPYCGNALFFEDILI